MMLRPQSGKIVSLILLVVVTTTPPSAVSSFVTKESDVGKKLFGKGRVEMKTDIVAAPRKASLDQYAPAAAELFGNMITPASILCGAIVPAAFASGIDFNGPDDESMVRKVLRKVFPFCSVASLASLLVAIMCASVTVNQLTENKPAMAASVWDLLQRDYAIPWAAVNSHFVLGLLGFMWLIATKGYFMGGGPAAFGLAMSGLTVMISIVNRGVASGGGRAGQRYGKSIVGLLQSYITLLWNRSRESFGPLEFIAVGLFLGSSIMCAKNVWEKIQN